MKLVNWNIGSLRSLLFGQSTRAKQSQRIIQKITESHYDLIGFQEVKIGTLGPDEKEIRELEKLFPGYGIDWRASQKPSKTSYAGTMFLTSPNINTIKVFYPTIMPNLDSEGRLLGLDFDDYIVINAYVPHYEYHSMEQHEQWMEKLTNYLGELNSQKPVIVGGDLAILPTKTTGQTTLSQRKFSLFREQYQRLLENGFVDAYSIAPNGEQDATWWAPNIPKQVDRGIRTDFWLVSEKLRDSITKSGPLDTGKRRDHAPIMLQLKTIR